MAYLGGGASNSDEFTVTSRQRIPTREFVTRRRRELVLSLFNTGIGGQHAYWQPARWVVGLGPGRHNERGRRGTDHRASHDRPAGGHLGRADRRSLFRGLRPDAVRRRADGQGELGSGGGIEGARRQALTNGQDVGLDQQGWYTFKVEGAKKPYKVETTFVQVGQSVKRPWNFYYWPTKADSIHEPWAGGNGRVDTMSVNGDDQLLATPGSYIPPGRGHRPGRPERHAGDPAGARRRRDLVPQPL